MSQTNTGSWNLKNIDSDHAPGRASDATQSIFVSPGWESIVTGLAYELQVQSVTEIRLKTEIGFSD